MSLRTRSTKTAYHVKTRLLRILIASYLMAVSAGIAPGPDLVPILAQFMPSTWATPFGTAVLFLLAYAMMAGIWLRLSILLLAISLVGTSFMENFIFAQTPDLGAMWRDMVVLCALLQSLTQLTNRELRQSSILRQIQPVRRLETRLSHGDPIDHLRTNTLPVRGRTKPHKAHPSSKEDDVSNIFA